VLNLIQSSHAQFNPAGSGDTFAGPTAERSPDGGFPGLLSLASGERAEGSNSGPGSAGSFREHLSGGPSSGNRLSDDRLSEERLSKDRLSRAHTSRDASFEDPSSHDPSFQSSDGHSGSAFVHLGPAGLERKKDSGAGKQPPDPTALALLMNPLLAGNPPVNVLQAVPSALPISVPISGDTTGVIAAPAAELANPQPEAVSGAGLQSSPLPANENGAAGANAPASQNKGPSVFSLNPNSASQASTWTSGDEDGSPTAGEIYSSIPSEARPHPKKSADVYAAQSGLQASAGRGLQPANENSPPGSDSSNPAPLQAANASVVYAAANSLAANSSPSDSRAINDAAVDAATSGPPAVTLIAAEVAMEPSLAGTDATGNAVSSASDQTTASLGAAAQPLARGAEGAKSPSAQNAAQVSAATSVQSANPSATQDLKHSTSKNFATAQNKSGSGAAENAAAKLSTNDSISLHRERQQGGAAHSPSETVTSKSGAENQDGNGRASAGQVIPDKDLANQSLASQDLANQGLANQTFANQGFTSDGLTSKDVAGKDPGKDLSEEFLNKALSDKDATDKGLDSKDLNSKTLHSPLANSSAASGPLAAAIPAAGPSTAANQATSPSAVPSAAFGPGASAPQSAANSSAGTYAASSNSPSARAGQDTAIQQSAVTGNVQLARLADHAGQSEMHIGMRMPAFGSVEVHTSVHQSEVGITVGSDHGDLKTFLNAEIPALRDSLNQQNLQFSHLNFMGAGSSASNSFDGDGRGNSQGFIYKPNFPRPEYRPEVPAIADHGGLEGELFPANQKGLSIHA
jgi:hypothetical protein